MNLFNLNRNICKNSTGNRILNGETLKAGIVVLILDRGGEQVVKTGTWGQSMRKVYWY